jgi:hypothetical protein
VAIRKPVLSVKEARNLAVHRMDLLPSFNPHDPATFTPPPETNDVLETLTTVASAAKVPPSPTLEPEASSSSEPVPVSAQRQIAPLQEIKPAESSGSDPVLEAKSDPVIIVAETSLPTPQVPGTDTGLRRKAAEKKSRKAAPDIGPPTSKRQKQQVVGKHGEEDKIQVFLSAALPARGVSKSFELLCRHYAPAKSLQMILRRALDDYEVILENGDLDNLPETYVEAASPEVCGIIQTSRIMPKRLVETARAYFDPLGFESDRAFGRKLASAALAIFFEIQTQHP